MIKSNKGVALATLVIAIIVMLTIAGTIVYTSTDTIKLRKLDDMYNDIRLLEQKVSKYYLENDDIPVLDKIELTGIVNENINPNDKENYYIIDLEKLGVFTLNYGKEYKEYGSNNSKNDVYIINEASHTIYYVKGIEINGTTYNSLEKEYEEIDGGGVLPREYKRVEYIESTGTQYIDTGFVGKTGIRTLIKFMANNVSETDGAYLLGSYINTSTNNRVYAPFISSEKKVGIGLGNYYTSDYIISLNTIYEVDTQLLSNRVNCTINGENIISKDGEFNVDGENTLYLFSRHLPSHWELDNFIGKIYACKIWDDDDLVRDLIPCYHKSTGRAGMYDLVNDVFYDSETTDNFVVPTLPSEYQQVEYIESTGTQYIDTGIKGSSKIKLKFEGAFERIKDYSYVTGSRNGYVSTTNGNCICFFANTANEDYQYYLTSYKTTNCSADKICVEMSRDGIFLNDELKYEVEQNEWSNNYNITIFAVNTNGTIQYGKNHKIYEYKIYEEDTLVRDFIPCYRKMGRRAGLYDLVEGKFYDSKTEENFVIPITLPDEYQQVEYIESTGTQYIDTGVIPNKHTQIEVIADYTNTPAGKAACIIGSRIAGAKDTMGILKLGAGTTRFDYGTSLSDIGTVTGKSIYKFNKNKAYVNGVLKKEISAYDFNSTYNLTMFSMNTAGKQDNYATNGKIYACKIWEADIIVRDFVPCYRKSDSELGMYDLIEDKFYTNKGTGKFRDEFYNLYEDMTFTEGYNLLADGTNGANANYKVSDYIQVEPNAIYISKTKNNFETTAGTLIRCCAYDENKNFVGLMYANNRFEVGYYEYEFTTPSNAKYIRVGYRITDTEIELVKKRIE